MAKMRLLTFMGMAVEYKEISFDTMEQELQIGAEDVEAFVIDGTNILNCFRGFVFCVESFVMLSIPPPVTGRPVCCHVILFAGVFFQRSVRKWYTAKLTRRKEKLS